MGFSREILLALKFECRGFVSKQAPQIHRFPLVSTQQLLLSRIGPWNGFFGSFT
jgi:hypothetical protein